MKKRIHRCSDDVRGRIISVMRNGVRVRFCDVCGVEF